jgi:hypothetical protein
MATKLGAYETREESHAALEEFIGSGEYPNAECREFYDDDAFSVWSGPISANKSN